MKRKKRTIAQGIVAQLIAKDPAPWDAGTTQFSANWSALQATARRTRMPRWQVGHIVAAQICAGVRRCKRAGVRLAPKPNKERPKTGATEGLGLELARMEG
jgi:hypothetical protein